VQPLEYLFEDFWEIFGKKFLADRILGNTEFQKTVMYVTGRKELSGSCRRKMKIDVWKYLQTIFMGLYAVSEQKLAHPDRVFGLLFPFLFLVSSRTLSHMTTNILSSRPIEINPET